MKTFSSDIRIHSTNHLEIKTSIPVDEPGKEKYYLQLYIFSPAQLNLTKKSYVQPGSFQSDINVHTRFSSPNLTLENLTSSGSSLSPLKRIRTILDTVPMLSEDDERKIIYEIQTLMNNYRTDMKNSVRILVRELKKKSKAAAAEETCSKKIRQKTASIKKILDEYRDLYTSFLDARISEELRTAFAWGDETLSIITTDTLVSFLRIVNSYNLPGNIGSQIIQQAKNEELYKKGQNYITFFDSHKENVGETILYRRGMLKKWSQSALYINSEESKTPRRVGHIIAGFAAASAMAFAVLATIFAQQLFVENTLPWAMLIILTYVFKDRIKEILKDILGKFLPRLVADNITRFRDPATLEKTGNAKEHFSALRLKEIPARIHSLRYEKPNPFRKLLPEENVLLYSRYIKIDSKKLRANHSRLSAVNEIIRVRIDNWLKEMDDPEETLYRIRNEKVVKVRGEKVYHLHLVLNLQTKKSSIPEELIHCKLIMNRKGLLRIEPVS